MKAIVPLFVMGFLWVGVGAAVERARAKDVPEIEALMMRVPKGAAWQDLPAELRERFAERARVRLEIRRTAWGQEGLAAKEKTLLDAPTQAMRENIDRVLSVKFATEVPDGFQMKRDVANAELKRLLLRIYLCETSSDGYMLLDHPEFRGWDGLAVKDVDLVDHQTMQVMATHMAETEAMLRKIPDEGLTATERGLRGKAYFTTRRYKHFGRPAVGRAGSFGLASVYHLKPELRPFANDTELLDAYNASMFSEFREVNKGSLESFVFDYQGEFDESWLDRQGLAPELAANVLKLGNLYKTRVLQHPERNTPCTFYSAEERAANWDSFTAEMIANEDGKESMEDYAAVYARRAQNAAREMQELAKGVVQQIFPEGAPELSAEQRKRVLERIGAEMKPAAMIETIYGALDEATGAKAASDKVRAAVARQPKIGGYGDGEKLKRADEEMILEMWGKVKAFIQREYRGYPVDIGALVPERPAILPHSEGCLSIGGEVSIGLKIEGSQAGLYSTLLHEIKHAIDQNSHAAVEGAAWEGAATSVERQVWPLFMGEVMAGEPTDLLVAKLVTAVEDVRLTATTDATLKIFLRPHGETSPDSFEYARQIVAGYGYTDPQVLSLRSRRANASTQYLQYEYGLVMYEDLLRYLQAGVGAMPRVDAYLLQACGMPSPKKNAASIERLKAAIEKRR